MPFVFTLINLPTAFDLLNTGFENLTSGDPGVIVAAFGRIGAMGNHYSPNLLNLFLGDPTIDFLVLLPGLLTWLVCGLLSAILTQSIKKGVVSSVVFITVEILLFMLMSVIAGDDLINDVLGVNDIMDGLVVGFLGGIIIGPMAFGIGGGVVGGLISQFAFGREEI